MGDETIFQSTFEYKLIYVFRINDESHKGVLKIGDATIHTNKKAEQLPPCCHDLNEAAKNRINEYTVTAGIAYELLHTELALYVDNDPKSKHCGKTLAFRDYKVHEVLKRSGVKNQCFNTSSHQNEWFRCDLKTAKNAIKAVKEGKSSLNPGQVTNCNNPIVFRPEQQEAINKTISQYKHSNRMLWNAKMRFGKTLTALQVAKQCGFKKTIIVTHRPVVSDGWYEDFSKIFYDVPEWSFGSKTKGEKLEQLIEQGKPFVYFASIQDLRGSNEVGGNFDKNDIVFKTDWDFVVVDEAHEGTQTKLGQTVLEAVVKSKKKGHAAKILELSGTPFNLLKGYEEGEIYTWDYIMEQEAKLNWPLKHALDSNPYDELPKLNIFTYYLNEKFGNYVDLDDKAFNFREFFRTWTGEKEKDFSELPPTAKVGDFVHEDDIKAFLKLIRKESVNTNYPFATEQYRDFFKHTLWMVPGVKEAKALSALLREDEVFSQFGIVNVAGDGDEEISSGDALRDVRNAIAHNERTITLSCGRLTTGVSVPEWTAVLMLAGSYSTTASQYLQTIFRVQTPANIDGKIKENCYVFDFAPDRTLIMIAESVKLSQKGAGSKTAEMRLSQLLNYCPVISISETEMKEYKVSYLLQQLKDAYVERVVRSGFDNPKLYNDELLKLNDLDWKEFERLKAIIGESTAVGKANGIDINSQGFSKEEHPADEETSSGSKKKTLTPEEKERKRQQKKRLDAISILRGISVRIPLLVYGADVPIDQDINIENFPELVDKASWKEFMPRGVTKADFKKFSKYYDKDIFVASTYRIRFITKTADELEPLERVKKIVSLFSTFKNPDKETVLTPWRVVNLHMAQAIGGYCFYDEKFENEIAEPRSIEIEDVTEKVFGGEDPKILEINSKTGLYPLYVAYSFYARATADKPELTVDEKKRIWNEIVNKNIFVICKTPMAKSITKRTLLGYQDAKFNAHAFDDLVNMMKEKQDLLVKKLLKPSFWNKGGKNMKFNAVVGNPPYQKQVENSHRQVPLYHYFYETSFKLAKFVTLISPAKFLFDAGLTPSAWNQKMLNDEHFKVISYYKDPQDVFPTADIKGGVAITVRNEDAVYGPIKRFVDIPILNGILEKVIPNTTHFISEIVHTKSTYSLTEAVYADFPQYRNVVTRGNEFIVGAKIFEDMPLLFHDKPEQDDFRIFGRFERTRVIKFISKRYIRENDSLKSFKVFLPGANGSGALGEKLGGFFVGKPNDLSTQTFMSIGSFKTEESAVKMCKYLKTKFLRIMLGTLKVTQNTAKDTWSNVPLLDFDSNEAINWNSSIDLIDQSLFGLYELNEEEIAFINETAEPME